MTLNRREFIKTSSGATATIAAAGLLCAAASKAKQFVWADRGEVI